MDEPDSTFPRRRRGDDAAAAGPYDALVLASFGGPEAPEQVVPFLENVTRGRGIPRERLEVVGEHYFAFGGRSPINDQNRALLGALRREMDARGLDGLPLVWGNRNWEPYLTDALRGAHDGGARRVLVLATSAYSSYSGCRQYREDVAGALTTLAGEGRAMSADKVRHYFNHPGFTAANTDAVLAALGRLDDAGAGAAAHLVFVTHSIPTAMAETAGPDGHRYERQHQAVVDEVTARVQGATGRSVPATLVYCSRSGPPTQPWLEPDVNDFLRSLEGVSGVVVSPVGFISDHMEVAFDLDTEARATCEEIGLPMERAATAGTDPAFVTGLVDLVLERAAAEAAGESAVGRPAGEVASAVPRPAVGAVPASWDVCPVGCCTNLRAPERPAACGVDWVAPSLAPSVPA